MSTRDPAATTGTLEHRDRLREVIDRRPRVSTVTGLLLALAFALVVTPIVLAESWAVDPRVAPGQPAPVTVRVGGDDVAAVIGARRTGGVVIARGELATPVQAQAVDVAVAGAPRGLAGFGAFGLVLFALAAGFTHHLKRSNRGRLLRVQLVLLGTIALGALVTKSLLLAYPLSVLAVPVALGAIVPTMVFDRSVGLASGVLAAVVMSLLVRFDVGVVIVLVVQAVSAAIVIPERPRHRWSLALAAGAVAMAGAALTYIAFGYLTSRTLPFDELVTPAASSFVAAGIGGAMAGLLAMPVLPLFELACDEITHRKLVALEDLSHPLLRQIAEKSPGTWQHSLAMANLAEVAANAIGASGRLVRVGAYFHDLGKSLQPTYFIENLAPGEPSPHDQLAPEVSCDAIFAHVTEGILLARRHKLPERIIDFMHMHHGDGVLEYFWAKCRETGNPRHLTVESFRYPGVPPQSRETAILAVCDAVEAASRTLKRPDARSVENLVQRIVYGKLHLGQLDESGLSMADLRRMSDSLREAIRHAHHGRIEYPWQREAAAEGEAAGAASGPTVAEGGRGGGERAERATQRLMIEPRLDSLDVPRPIQWDDRGREAGLGAVLTPPPGAVVVTPPGAAAPARGGSELAAFGDTIDLAIATTAGLGVEAASGGSSIAPSTSVPAAMPAVPSQVPSSSVGPTADALADAVVQAEAPTDHSGRARPGSTLVPPLGMTLPATPAPAATAPLDEAALRRAARPTEPLILPSARARADRAMGAVPPTTGELAALDDPSADGDARIPELTDPVPAFHRATSATFDIPEQTPRVPAPHGGAASDDDEPEIEVEQPPEDAVSGEIDDAPASPPPPLPPLVRPVPPPPPITTSMAGSAWLGSLSARIDAMLDAEDEPLEVTDTDILRDRAPTGNYPVMHDSDADLDDSFSGDTIRRPPPTPPGRTRMSRATQPVEPDDIEASLELSPTLRPAWSGVFVGPPPATRAGRSAAAAPAPPAVPRPAVDDHDEGADSDEGPTRVGPQPSGSMLPPRARRD